MSENKAIGMIETNTVTAGFLAADLILKTAAVEIIFAKTVCPGKYLILFSGDISAVRSSHDAAAKKYTKNIADSFVLGNPHESIFSAMLGEPDTEKIDALGIIETYSAASGIRAADAAAKTAIVKLIEIRLCVGMCGKSYVLFTGSVAAVEAAVDKVKTEEQDGMLLDCAVIANPSPDMASSIF